MRNSTVQLGGGTHSNPLLNIPAGDFGAKGLVNAYRVQSVRVVRDLPSGLMFHSPQRVTSPIGIRLVPLARQTDGTFHPTPNVDPLVVGFQQPIHLGRHAATAVVRVAGPLVVGAMEEVVLLTEQGRERVVAGAPKRGVHDVGYV